VQYIILYTVIHNLPSAALLFDFTVLFGLCSGKSVKVEWEVATILAQVSNSASVLVTGSLTIIVYPILSLCGYLY